MKRLFVGKSPILGRDVVLYVNEGDKESSVRISTDAGPYHNAQGGYVEAIRRLCRASGLL